MKDLDWILAAALQFLGKPYLWSGQGPNGYDCSGLVREVLAPTMVLPKDDLNSQGMHDWLLKTGAHIGSLESGALAFYGADDHSITHVALLLSPDIIIEAAGGDHTTTSVEQAIKQNAFVKLRNINYRKDLVSVLMPIYK